MLIVVTLTRISGRPSTTACLQPADDALVSMSGWSPWKVAVHVEGDQPSNVWSTRLTVEVSTGRRAALMLVETRRHVLPSSNRCLRLDVTSHHLLVVEVQEQDDEEQLQPVDVATVF